MFDLKIIGGQIIDGTGAPARRVDVGVTGDRIAALDDLSGAEAHRTIDLTASPSAVVCPGFIDVHTHSDAYLLVEPSAPSKIWQGVTTEVVGNCGCACAPLIGDARIPTDWAQQTYPGTWRSVAEYRALLAQVRPAPNVVFLVGHNTIRGGVVGYDQRSSTLSEVRAMCDALRTALDDGARGLSTGLVYTPGLYSTPDEVVALAQVVADHDGIYTSHMRSESVRLLEAIDEVLALASATGVRVQISHLKASGQGNWHKLPAALERIRTARARGAELAADRYPYTSSCTDLDIIFPAWAAAGTREEIMARLHDPQQRRRMRDAMLAERADDYWQSITVGSTQAPENTAFTGMPLTHVADALGVEPVDAVLHLGETDALSTTAFFNSMSDENMRAVLSEPYVMIGSDASIRSTRGVLSQDHPHPRAYGTFPRFLRMALDGTTVALPEAIRKMTQLPANHFRLEGRGELRVGYAADLLVFDAATVRDVATFAHPHQLAQGVKHVVVNGVHTLADGTLTDDRGGLFL